MDMEINYTGHILKLQDRAYAHPETWRCEPVPEMKYSILRNENRPLWKEHWDDVLDYESDGTPIRLRDLFYYTDHKDIHSTFRKELLRQLKPQINAGLGIDLDTLTLPYNVCELIFTDTWQINLNGWSYTMIGLRISVQSAILIRWQSLNPDVPCLYLKDVVFPKSVRIEICSERHGIETTWPQWKSFNPNNWIERIKADLPTRKRKPRHKSKPLIRRTAYPMTLEPQDWPDVRTRLQFREPISEEILSSIYDLCVDFMEEWDKNFQEYGAIHDLTATNPEEHFVEIQADFGSCEPEPIIPRWIDRLDALFGRQLAGLRLY